MKYDYERTDGAVPWDDYDTVLDYLQRSLRLVGPFIFKIYRGVCGGRNIEAFVNQTRILRDDIVYSNDPEVIAAVVEAAACLNANAVQADIDRANAELENRRRAAEEKASLFKNAARLWNKGRK